MVPGVSLGRQRNMLGVWGTRKFMCHLWRKSCGVKKGLRLLTFVCLAREKFCLSLVKFHCAGAFVTSHVLHDSGTWIDGRKEGCSGFR